MKLSILTATYNRGRFLTRLYESIVNNLIDDMDIEWLIMDDGSNDDTQEIVSGFHSSKHFEIKFYKQKNQGKMQAINNLMEYVTGELCVECDSDDFFNKGAFKTIYDVFCENFDKENIYAFTFLKYNQDGKNIGGNFQDNEVTTMFDLYFKKNENGEKALVFISKIRKQYKYILEKKEKFVTEASMFYRMDEKYNILCINFPIMICQYLEDGYTNNSLKQLIDNPNGYYKYFEFLMTKDLKGVKFKKKIYIIKHYILFSYLVRKKINLKNVKNIYDKLLITILFVPGRIMSRLKFKRGI